MKDVYSYNHYMGRQSFRGFYSPEGLIDFSVHLTNYFGEYAHAVLEEGLFDYVLVRNPHFVVHKVFKFGIAWGFLFSVYQRDHDLWSSVLFDIIFNDFDIISCILGLHDKESGRFNWNVKNFSGLLKIRDQLICLLIILSPKRSINKHPILKFMRPENLLLQPKVSLIRLFRRRSQVYFRRIKHNSLTCWYRIILKLYNLGFLAQTLSDSLYLNHSITRC